MIRLCLLTIGIVIASSLLAVSADWLNAQNTPAPASSRPQQTQAPLDINRATAEELVTLPGVGPDLAKRIILFREKQGPFRRVEDLLAVNGMGYKKWKAIQPLVRVGK